MQIKERTKIRHGQFWKKRDTGVIIQIMATKRNAFATTRLVRGTKKAHSIPFKTLWLFWEKI